MIDPAALTADLIRCASVTPQEGGALQLLERLLTAHGFQCTRVDRGDVSNLFARWGQGKTFGFNGHTDVVPVGDLKAWSVDPFGAEIRDGFLYGRGATDMKSGVAAFAAAAIDFVTESPPDGSVVLAITGDEEGPAKDGTVALLDWMQAQGERMDHCLVGEPTCPDVMGDMMKIGRRGSMNGYFTITGVQGHAAYPHRANNPCQLWHASWTNSARPRWTRAQRILTPQPWRWSPLTRATRPQMSFQRNVAPRLTFGSMTPIPAPA